jgi:hypothetical protein
MPSINRPLTKSVCGVVRNEGRPSLSAPESYDERVEEVKKDSSSASDQKASYDKDNDKEKEQGAHNWNSGNPHTERLNKWRCATGLSSEASSPVCHFVPTSSSWLNLVERWF